MPGKFTRETVTAANKQKMIIPSNKNDTSTLMSTTCATQTPQKKTQPMAVTANTCGAAHDGRATAAT